MKNTNYILSAIASVLSLIALIGADSSIVAQQGGNRRIDTGIVTLGPHQELRITVNGGLGNDKVSFRFVRMEYASSPTGPGTEKLEINSHEVSDLIALGQGEAASFLLPYLEQSNVRGVVISNNRNIKVLGIVFDTSTQRVVAIVPTETFSLN